MNTCRPDEKSACFPPPNVVKAFTETIEPKVVALEPLVDTIDPEVIYGLTTLEELWIEKEAVKYTMPASSYKEPCLIFDKPEVEMTRGVVDITFEPPEVICGKGKFEFEQMKVSGDNPCSLGRSCF